jgi:hypothetical protein
MFRARLTTPSVGLRYALREGDVGVRYLDGTQRWLDPTGTADEEDGADYGESGGARIYHVRSDTVFDFKPRVDRARNRRKFRAFELEDLLDVLVQGNDRDLEKCGTLLGKGGFAAIHELAGEISSPLDRTPFFGPVVMRVLVAFPFSSGGRIRRGFGSSRIGGAGSGCTPAASRR